MKKLSINLLKVSLLLILVLCVFSVISKVEANNKIIFTLDYNGGEKGENKSTEIVEDADGKITIVDVGAKRDGYELLGWSRNSNSEIAEYVEGEVIQIKNDETLYAIWADEDAYNDDKITFKLDYNNGEEPVEVDDKQTPGIITIVDVSAEKEGYKLLGWSRKKDSKIAEFIKGDKLGLREGEILYAIWADEETYNDGKITITLDYNNGEEPVEVDDEHTPGVITIVDVGEKREGYKLLGWSESSDGNTRIFNEGEVFEVKEGTTLYAIWEEVDGGYNPPAQETPEHSDGTDLAKDDYMKYVNGTNNSKNDTWNLRESESLSSTVIGEIGEGDIIQIIEEPTNSIWVKVKVVEATSDTPNGEMPVTEGQTGWIYFNDDAKAGFYKVEYTPGSDDENGDGEVDGDAVTTPPIDTGFMGVVMNLISSIIEFIVENVLPLVEPMITTTVETVGPALLNMITGVLGG